jgi:transposase-like protein
MFAARETGSDECEKSIFRRVIYTTNAIESVHARLRKIIKTQPFPK